MGMPADLAERQNIIDRFQEFVFRAPSEEEINYFLNTTSYQLDTYLRKDPEYAASNDYQSQLAKIRSLEAAMWRGAKFDNATIDQWIRRGYSLERIMSMVREHPYYKQLYPDKPAEMSESDYNSKLVQMAQQAESARDLWAKWKLTNLSDKQLHSIFIGGTDPLITSVQKEWEQVKSLEAANQAMAGKRINTDIKMTALGPQQQLMQGIDTSAANNNQLTYEDFAKQVIGEPWQRSPQLAVPEPEIKDLLMSGKNK